MHKKLLLQLREHYALSLHGVGLSLGSFEKPDVDHLKQFKELIDLTSPFIVSDHAAWSANGNAHLNDLLPLPYTAETLSIVARNISITQDYLGRQILVENPSTYIAFRDNEMDEAVFMNALAEKTGCGLLLDINNIYVQSHNHSLNPYEYISTIKPSFVGEIHLAGHTRQTSGSETILIDTHSKPVCDDVWKLFEFTVKKIGKIPTLIEWDQDYPPLTTLLEHAEQANQILIRDVHHDAT